MQPPIAQRELLRVQRRELALPGLARHVHAEGTEAGDEDRPARDCGERGKELTVEVRNPLAARHGARLPGAGAGLIGLTERAELAGGRLEHGPTPEREFVVRAWLPWPVEATREEIS